MVATINRRTLQMEKDQISERSLPSLGTASTSAGPNMVSSSSLNESNGSIGRRKIKEPGNRKRRSSSKNRSHRNRQLHHNLDVKNGLTEQASASSSRYSGVDKGPQHYDNSNSSIDLQDVVASGQTTQEEVDMDSQSIFEVTLKGEEDDVGVMPPSSPGRSLRSGRRSYKLRSGESSDHNRRRSRSQDHTIDIPQNTRGSRKHSSSHHDRIRSKDMKRDSNPNSAQSSSRSRARSRDSSRDGTRDRSRDRTRNRSRDRSMGDRTNSSRMEMGREKDQGDSSHARRRRSRSSAEVEQDDYSGSPHSTSRRRKRTLRQGTRRGNTNKYERKSIAAACRTTSIVSVAESVNSIEDDVRTFGESTVGGSSTIGGSIADLSLLSLRRSQSLSQEKMTSDELRESLGPSSIKSKESHDSYNNSGKLDAMLEQNSKDVVSLKKTQSSSQSTGQQSHEQEKDDGGEKADLENVSAPLGPSANESVGESGHNSISLRSYYTPEVRSSRRKTMVSSRNNLYSQQVSPGTLVVPTSLKAGNDRRVRTRGFAGKNRRVSTAGMRNGDNGQPTPEVNGTPNDLITSQRNSDEENAYSSEDESEKVLEDEDDVGEEIMLPPFTAVPPFAVSKEHTVEPVEKRSNAQKNWRKIAKKVVKKSKSILKNDDKRKTISDTRSFGQLPSDDDCDDLLGNPVGEGIIPSETWQVQHDVPRLSPGDSKRRNRILDVAKSRVNQFLHKGRNDQAKGISTAEMISDVWGALQDSETFDYSHDGNTCDGNERQINQEAQDEQDSDTEGDAESIESDGQVEPAQFNPESLVVTSKAMEETNTKSPDSKSRRHRSSSPTRVSRRLSGDTTQNGNNREDSRRSYGNRSSSRDRSRGESEKISTRNRPTRSKSRSRKSRTMNRRSEHKPEDEAGLPDGPGTKNIKSSERARRTSSRADVRSISPGSLKESISTRVRPRRSKSNSPGTYRKNSPGTYRNSLSKRREAMKQLASEKALRLLLDDEGVDAPKIPSGSGGSNAFSSSGTISRRNRITRIDSAGRIRTFEPLDDQSDGDSMEDESLNDLLKKAKQKKRRDSEPETRACREGIADEAIYKSNGSLGEFTSGRLEW